LIVQAPTMTQQLSFDRANFHLNQRAAALCQAFVHDPARYRVSVHDTGLHVPVIDCGINVRGSLQAGLLLARIATSDLADICLVPSPATASLGPHVVVQTDHPVAACMLSQYAGWQVTGEKYFAMGSGPMRAAAGKEDLLHRLNYHESTDTAVGVLETAQLPPAEVADQIAASCDVHMRKLTLLAAPTASLAGTLQIVARSVETALHKLDDLKFDLWRIVSGWGSAPLPPVAGDDLAAIGRTNDAILYGGEVHLWVTGDDSSIEELIGKVPSSGSPDHGRPFAEIFASYDRDFYKIDPHLFSPARIVINNLETGSTFCAGQLQLDILRTSFGI
jgi:methenyltetrahydromethanopterin cyclohydrolase